MNDNYEYNTNDFPEVESDTPAEFADDFIVETDDDYPDEYGATDETAASDGKIDSPYGNIDIPKPQPLPIDEYPNYNTNSPLNFETATDCDNKDCGNTDCNNTDCGNTDCGNTDCETGEDLYVVDGNNESAATCDDNCDCDYDNCDCTTAEQRCKLDDYEIISDVLGSEKQIVKLYSTALCEAAEEHFRDVIRENFDEAAADQYKAFCYMQSRGLYKTEQASETSIAEAKQQFTPLCDNCK